MDFCTQGKGSESLYEKNKYDVVIINFTLDFGHDILEQILKVDPKQRVITVSEKLIGSEEKGGDYCQAHYNKRRLLKPVDIIELIKLIKNFDNNECKYKNKFYCNKGLIDIMNDIVKRYPNTTYDKMNHKIHSENIRYILDVADLLSKNNIDYTVVDEHTIKI